MYQSLDSEILHRTHVHVYDIEVVTISSTPYAVKARTFLEMIAYIARAAQTQTCNAHACE